MSSYGSTPAKLRSLAENLTEGRSPRASLLLIPCRRPRVTDRNLIDLYADAGGVWFAQNHRDAAPIDLDHDGKRQVLDT